MSYDLIITEEFERAVKKLARKYPSLKQDLNKVFQELSSTPKIGIGLGGGVYKVRMAISSKGKGKSAGARIITFVMSFKEEIYLLKIYDKSNLPSVSKKEISTLLKKYNLD